MPGFSEEDMDRLFTYHKPVGDQTERYKAIRLSGRAFAKTILKFTPASAEQTLAIRKAQEAVMWANAGIACNE
jgi:hypothetical protein